MQGQGMATYTSTIFSSSCIQWVPKSSMPLKNIGDIHIPSYYLQRRLTHKKFKKNKIKGSTAWVLVLFCPYLKYYRLTLGLHRNSARSAIWSDDHSGEGRAVSFLKLSSSNSSNNDSTVNESAEIIEHIVKDNVNNMYLFQVNRDNKRKGERKREQAIEPVQEFKH